MALLQGVRVIDLTSVVMGPLSTQFLGELGADVIKVESLEGDILRRSVPCRNAGMGQGFLNANRNKRSICIDLKREESRSIFSRLIQTADVLVYNMRPKAMARLRLTYEEVREINQRLIYVGAFGFSEKGPYAGRPAYDDVIQGLSGLPYLISKTRDGEPGLMPMSFVDRTVANHVFSAVLAALYHRERSGVGQRIDVPMFEIIAHMILGEHLEGATFIPSIGPMGHARSISKERRPYRTSDGYICTLIYTDQHWRSFLSIVEETWRWEDLRFSSYTERMKNIDLICSYLSDQFVLRSTEDWLKLLSTVDIPVGRVNSLEDLLSDEHLNEIEFFKTIEHPSEGRIRAPRYPVEFHGAQSLTPSAAPRKGQHTRSILEEIGATDDEISALIEAKALLCDPSSD